MKRMLLTALVAFFALPVFAQDETLEPLYTSPDGKVQFDMLSHMGFGYNIVKTDDFKPAFSSEFFMNLLDLSLLPTEHFGIELGVDFVLNNFGSKESAFVQTNDHLITPVDFSEIQTGSLDKRRGGINVASFTAPLVIKGIFDKVCIGVGAEACYNVSGSTYYRFRQDNRRVEVTETKAKATPFTYDILAFLSYDELGIYFKYRPANVKILPEGGVDLSFMTVGLVIGL